MRLDIKGSAKRAMVKAGVYRAARLAHRRFLRPSKGAEIRKCSELYSQFLGPGDLAFDVGANVGNKLDAMLALGARVVAVEPQPSCREELMAMFGRESRFTLVPEAVGSVPGRATLRIGSSTELSSLKPGWYMGPGGESGSVEVGVTTLAALMETYGVPRFLKLDVEGFELEALRGMSKTPEAMSLEYHRDQLEELSVCLDYLEGLGRPSYNFTVTNSLSLASPRWLDREGLSRLMESELSRSDSLWGGDVFASFVPPA